MQSNSPYYCCSQCGETYEKTRPAEDCWKEVNEIMPEAIHDDMAIVCDDCWQEFMIWFKSLTPEQKKKMRDEHNKKAN